MPIVHPARSHAPLLQAINNVVQKKRNAEIDAMVRKRLVESKGGDPHISAALELFLQNMIEAKESAIALLRCESV